MAPSRIPSGPDEQVTEPDRGNPGDGDRGGRVTLSLLWKALKSPGESLTQRIVHGGLWTMLQRAGTRLLGLARLAILARLLAPQDFGLFGIALLTQGTLDTLLHFGIDSALIQRKKGTEGYLNAAWTLNVLKALIVATGLLLAAPFVATFFDAPGATSLIRVMAVVVMLQGMTNIGIVYFRKELELSKEFALGFAVALLNALVAIPLAVLFGSAWALMAGILAGAAGRFLLSYILHPYRPSLEFDARKVGELWTFGKWLFGGSTFIYVSNQVDDILVGRWLGAASLGVYQIAFRISNAVATEVTHVISGVTFPAYSKLQSKQEALRDGFLSTLALTSLIVVPLAVAVALFIPEIVRHVLGTQWTAVQGPVLILAAAGLIRAFSACWGPLYLAQARTEKPFWKQLIRAILTIAPAYPLTMAYGIEGMSVCVLIGIIGAFLYDLFWAGARGGIDIPAVEVLRASVGPIAATVVAAAAVAGLRLGVGGGMLEFLALGALYVGLYAALIILLEIRGTETGLGKVASLLTRMR